MAEYRKQKPEQVGLPPRPFLYTLDQISVLVSVDERSLSTKIVYFEGRTVGRRTDRRLHARNIAAEGETPIWRVSEAELIRWMKKMGYKYYERGWLS